MIWPNIGRLWALAFVIGLASVGVAQAETLDYTIYKESDPVGHDVYTINKEGDVTTVKVHTHTDVSVLFFKFHYNHDRTEVWKAGVMQSLVSDTDDDGTKHHVSVHRDGNSLIGGVDGKSQILPGDVLPFTLWARSLLKRQVFFDVADFEQLKTEVEDKGPDKITINGKAFDTRHYKITGDLNWDLWYDANGVMLKSAFKRRGFPVFFVRE